MKECKFPVHYRYTEGVREDGLYLTEHRYYPVRETACFYFIVPEWQWRVMNVVSYKAKKRVSKDSVSRFCYPSKKDALRSFKARKRSQLRHAEAALDTATAALKFLDKITEVSERELNMGHHSFIENYIFD
jgi:hypothetical protein